METQKWLWYAATVLQTRDVEELEDFYTELSSLIRQVPKHNVLIIGGDLLLN